MVTRRKVLEASAALLATVAVSTTVNATSAIYGNGDDTWVSTFRRTIAAKLTVFFGNATADLPLVGHSDDGDGQYQILDQFLIGFLGAPTSVEALPDGRWLFGGCVPHDCALVSFVVMSADQSRIDTAMMAYSICPRGGVDDINDFDPDHVVHKIKCEIDPGWAIFVPRYEVRDDTLIANLATLARRSTTYQQQPLVNQGVRLASSIQVKTKIVEVP